MKPLFIMIMALAFLFEVSAFGMHLALINLVSSVALFIGIIIPFTCWHFYRRFMRTPKHIREENHEASKLAKKANKQIKLTEIEQNRLERYISEGILKGTLRARKGNVKPYYYLSNDAIVNLFSY